MSTNKTSRQANKTSATLEAPTVGKSALRKQLRARRNALTDYQQRLASLNLAETLLSVDRFRFAKRIGVYLANDGEIDLTPLIHWYWQRGAEVYLPVVSPVRKGQLWFVLYTSNSQLVFNQYGIAEPVPQPELTIHPLALDLVLTPLVGFDKNGHRIGMGGGYYDRTFKYKQQLKQGQMIGIAHWCQKLDRIETDRWDIDLQGVATDQGMIWC